LFTPTLCQATANALMEGHRDHQLVFRWLHFPSGEYAMMMNLGLVEIHHWYPLQSRRR
jgi:hypothetical protein